MLIARPAWCGEAKDALKAIRFPAENVRSTNRLFAADRLISFRATPETALLLIGNSTPTIEWQPWTATASWLGPRLAEQYWPDALREYQQMLEESIDAVVPAARYDAPVVQSAHIQTLCHLRLATAPHWVLRAYRQRIDARAKRWLAEAADKRDAKLLRRLVGDMFCSSVADQALDLLGDLAFERGNFAEAGHWWRRISPSTSEVVNSGIQPTLQFPDPDVDVARVRAKQILAAIFQMDLSVVQTEIIAFGKLHPDAAGWFAGRDGKYLDNLADYLKSVPRVAVVERENDWNSFAGSSTRNHHVEKGIPFRLWANGPTWRIPLPFEPVASNGTAPQPGAEHAYHPVVSGDRVYLADHRSVVGFHLFTGKQLFRYDLKDADHADALPKRSQTPKPGCVYSMTIQYGRLFVRLGRQSLTAQDDAAASYLVCLDVDETPGKELWARRFAGTKEKPEMIEGSPIVRGRHVLCAVSRLEWDEIVTSVTCCDAKSGEILWTRPISEVPAKNDARRPTGSHLLLTAAGRHAFICTHAGAICALDIDSGRPAWAVRYTQPRFRKSHHVPHGYGPPVYWNHRLYVAPADSHFLFCFDAATGDLLWQRDDLDVAQLLGVARGRLVFTTPSRLQAVDATTGLSDEGWMLPTNGSRITSGRGLLAGGWVFWPTRDAKPPVRAVTIEYGSQDGKPTFLRGGSKPPRYFDPTQLRQLVPGNMAFGNDCLVIATGNELVGYVAPKRLLPMLEANAARPGADLGDQLLLAEALADAGKSKLAFKFFSDVIRSKSKTASKSAGTVQQALAGRCALLWKMAKETENLAVAESLLQKAAGPEFPVPWRLQSLVRLAERYQCQNATAKAQRIWTTIANDPVLCDGTVFFNGTPYIARWLADDKLVGQTKTARQSRAPAEHRPSPVNLTFPLENSWRISDRRLLVLENGARSDWVFVYDNQSLERRNAKDGSVEWQSPIGAPPNWFARHGQSLLLGGSHSLFGLGAPDGKPKWRMNVSGLLNVPSPSVGPFVISDNHCIFLVNNKRLVAVVPGTGRVVWATRLPSATCAPLLHVAGDSISVHSAQATYVIDAKTGRLKESPTHVTGEMTRLSDKVNVVCNANHLMCIEAQTNRVKWRFKPPYPESLDGRPISVIVKSNCVLAMVSRNFGTEIYCLSALNGRPVWNDSIAVVGDTLKNCNMVLDDNAIYIAKRSELAKYALATGTRLWRHTLPETAGGWSLSRLSNAIGVVPKTERAFRATWTPIGGSYLGLPLHRCEHISNIRDVRLVHTENGRLLQKLTLLGDATTVRIVQIGARIVLSDGRRVWSLIGKAEPTSGKKSVPTNLAAWETESILLK